MKNNLQISLFLPAYNEEANINKTIQDVDQILKRITTDYEILVVNDGSSDQTGKFVRELARNNSKIRMITHAKNRGYGGAFKSGLYGCRFPWIIQMDSDGQFNFVQITKFLPLTKKADLIMGFRLDRSDSLYRRFMARILKLVDLLLFGLDVKDVDCGFKLFKKEIVDKISRLKTESAITVTEFVVRAKNAKFRIAQVGVHHFSRKGGEQTGGKPGIIFKAAWQGILLWLYLLKEKIWK